MKEESTGASYCTETRLLALGGNEYLLAATTSVSRLRIPGDP